MLLGLGDALSAAQTEHVEGCAACSRAAAGFARLDALLASEPLPLAPQDFVVSVRRALASRQEEVRWLRRHLAALVAAAALLALAAGPFLLGTEPMGSGLETFGSYESWTPRVAPLEGVVEEPTTLWRGLGLELEQAVAALPSAPLLVLLLAIPLVAGLNWALARPRPGRLLA